MKKTTLIATLLLGITSLSAQKFKDKANGALNKVSNNEQPAPSSSNTTSGSESQFVMIENFVSAKSLYTIKIKEKESAEVKPSDKTPAEFLGEIQRNANGKVEKFKSFSANHPVYPTCYVYDAQTYIFINNVCFTFSYCKIRSAEDVDKCLIPGQMARWGTVYGTTKDALKGMTYETAKEMLKNYFIEAGKGLESAKADEKIAAVKADEEKRAKYSIKGKDVQSISLQWSAEKTHLHYKEHIGFKILATLKDGSKLTAGDGNGFFDDYLIEVSGCDPAQASIGYVINNFVETPLDKIVITVTSKYHTGVKAEKSFIMKYEVPSGEKFKFHNNNPRAGDAGVATRVEIKQVKDLNTGATLIAYRIYSMDDYTKPLFAFKCSPETPVEISTAGNNGASGYQNGVLEKSPENGGRGGDGGNLKILIDPSVVVTYNVNYVTSGGKGGAAGRTAFGSGVAGIDGREGKMETIKQKLNW